MPPVFNSSFMQNGNNKINNGGPPPGFNNNNGPSLQNNNSAPPNMPFNNGPPPSFNFNNGPPSNNGRGNEVILSGNSATAGPSMPPSQISLMTESSTNNPVSPPSSLRPEIPVLDHPDPSTLNNNNPNTQPASTNQIFANNFDFTQSTPKPSRFDDMEMAGTTTEATTTPLSVSATRPLLQQSDQDTKLRPTLQISNPFPDEVYAKEQQDFRQRYPITSSVEYFNNVPQLPPDIKLLSGGYNDGSRVVEQNTAFTSKLPSKNRKNIPSSASIPDIYYKIKDGSSLNNLALDKADLKKQQQHDNVDSSSSNSNLNQVKVKK
jgi:hypothetical protein